MRSKPIRCYFTYLAKLLVSSNHFGRFYKNCGNDAGIVYVVSLLRIESGMLVSINYFQSLKESFRKFSHLCGLLAIKVAYV